MVGEAWDTQLGDALVAVYQAALEITNDQVEASIYTKQILEQWLNAPVEPVAREQAA